MADDDETPSATPSAAVLVDLPEDLYIPEPFAFAGSNANVNARLLNRDDEAGVGSFAYVQCDCGQPFRIDLLNGDVKACPNCKARFCHFLVIASDDDPDVVWQTYRYLLDVNGFPTNTDDPGARIDEGDQGDGDDDGDGDDE